MKSESLIALNSIDDYLYCDLSQALVELGYMQVILQEIQKGVFYLDKQGLSIMLGRVNEPLTNFSRNLKELNLKIERLS